MEVCLEYIISGVAILLTVSAALVITYFKITFSYWKQRKVPFIEPSIPFGNSENPFGRSVKNLGVKFEDYYNEFKSRGEKHGGVYIHTSPVYIPIDPEYIKSILTKDFQYFMDHGIYCNEENDPLGTHLFALNGQKWRNMRTKLSPTFTSGKMKTMFGTLLDCGKQLLEAMDGYTSTAEPVEIYDVLGQFNTDIIGSCAFGIECNSFKNPNAEFRTYGKKIFERNRMDRLRSLFFVTYPKLAKKIGVMVTKKDVSEFFLKAVKDTVEYREQNNVRRSDFMQILIDLKNTKNETGEDTLTVNEIAAQAYLFFLAGFDSASQIMTFCLLELSVNEDIQVKVRAEIDTILEKYGNNVTYEAMIEMRYLENNINETLRKYPPGPVLLRRCTIDYEVPGTDTVIDKDTTVMVSVRGLHHDPEYYPDPDKYDPERFNEENKNKRPAFTFVPFGEGPRFCIGQRFGMMQTKVGLILLLSNYSFSLNSKTPYPIEFGALNFSISSKHGIWLDIKKNDLPRK